jgi:preprotein translocase subunit SecA
MALFKSLFDSSEKYLKKIRPIISKINSLEPEFESMSDDELKSRAGELRTQVDNGEKLDNLLVPSFALVRESARRTLGQRPFDTQLIGGMALHHNKIAEMKTGEGKTLAATLPVFLNALEGKGVHVITVNDYLATRDAEWMGKIYTFLGLTIGSIQSNAPYEDRRNAYRSDITYGTNNEYGFDYLRDNMARDPSQLVQRDLHFAIVDEVDSILVDEARTPLIISGPAEKSTHLYGEAAKVVKQLREEDYTLDEKNRNVSLTQEGVQHVEKILNITNLYGQENVELNRHVTQSLKAHRLFKNDVDYIMKDKEIVIVDEFTGRLMFGRRYSDGLHQAIEAKEGLEVRQENQTLATITFQNYFRMYKKLAGMTGTAKTEENEFREIYGLEVVVVPTNMPLIRKDRPDVIWKNERAKFKNIILEVEECYKKGQPVLVGTRSIEKSEDLSKSLKRKNIPHAVLNAKYHEQEAGIIAKAGELNAVTIATNMAGRGVDIALSDGVVERGGLHIIGTERHDSRRIDNQLRGRSGRQGDPGETRFHLALDDELLRIFGGEKLKGLFEFLKIDEDTPLEHPMLTRTIENSQKKVEARNFDTRKYVLEYDDVLNRQREIIYAQRQRVLHGENLQDTVIEKINSVAEDIVNRHASTEIIPEEWDLKSLRAEVVDLTAGRVADIKFTDRETLIVNLVDTMLEEYKKREEEIGSETMRNMERYVLLYVVDGKWKDHLYSMDNLREGIGLRSYGQRNPIQEYQNEGFAIFNAMLASIWEDTVKYLFRFKLQPVGQKNNQQTQTNQDRIKESPRAREINPEREQVSGRAVPKRGGGHNTNKQPIKRNSPKVGRNDPCPCGSGKKYKQCCGKNK